LEFGLRDSQEIRHIGGPFAQLFDATKRKRLETPKSGRIEPPRRNKNPLARPDTPDQGAVVQAWWEEPKPKSISKLHAKLDEYC
jgi:hypothetical protein